MGTIVLTLAAIGVAAWLALYLFRLLYSTEGYDHVLTGSAGGPRSHRARRSASRRPWGW